MMNLGDADRIRLIDISSEDDFLIDSNLDSSSFDLRLSVAFETQKELGFDLKSGAPLGTKASVPSLAVKERRNFRLERVKCDNSDRVCEARKSLAWDQSFFTSPGILEFDELCLVNQGFRNLEVSASHDIEAVKGKVCHGRNISHKQSIGAGRRQKIQSSSMKTKLASPSKMMSMQSSKRQEMTTGRSEAFSGVVAKSQLVQSTSSRKESLKSTRMMGQASASTVYTRKPPLRAISKIGLPTSYSVDFSPHKSSDNILTASVLKKGSEITSTKDANSPDAEALNYQKEHSSIKQSPLSYKSNLRLPSQKIGFFDMKPESFRQDQDGIKHPNKGQKRTNKPSLKKQTHSLDHEEKENLSHPEDTVIELGPKKDSSPSPSRLVANRSLTSSGHSGQSSSSSKKTVTKPQRRQAMLSPIQAPRTPFLSKVTSLKKSSIL